MMNNEEKEDDTPTLLAPEAPVPPESEEASSLSSSSPSESSSSSWWTKEQLEQYAYDEGIELSLTTLGPGFRAIARSKYNTTRILGYIEGYIRPAVGDVSSGNGGKNLLHLDRMEVFRPIVKMMKTEEAEEEAEEEAVGSTMTSGKQQRKRKFRGGGTTLGVGLLIAYIVLLYGYEQQQCTIAEFLAIDDGDKQHRRLVKLYKQSGFDYIKYVGDDFYNIPDRLIWGGCGTLLRKEITYLLLYWTKLMKKSMDRKKLTMSEE